MCPGDPGAVLARIQGLLVHYRSGDLPESVKRAVAADWYDDIGEFPLVVIELACRDWRRGPKCRYRPLSGEIRGMRQDALGRLPIVADRLRKLLSSIPRADVSESTEARANIVRARVVALAATRRMPLTSGMKALESTHPKPRNRQKLNMLNL